jgi:hypothetical protein
MAYALRGRGFRIPYLREAYEPGFVGRALDTAKGFGLETLSLNGDTGIGELVLFLKPSPNLPLYLDLRGPGNVGSWEGVIGRLLIGKDF